MKLWWLAILVVIQSINHTMQKPESIIISNLNSQIDIFSQAMCFILLDNHLGINILPLSHPLAIREINKIEKPENTTSKFISFTELPELYSDGKPKPGLNFFEFTSNHKPWNCLVHLQIYPDFSELMSAFVYPYVFHWKASTHGKYFEFMEPSLVPMVHILVLNKPKKRKNTYKRRSYFSNRDTELFSINYYIGFFVSKHDYDITPKPLLKTNIFLLGHTEKVSESIAHTSNKIKTFTRIENCGICKSSKPALDRKNFEWKSISTELQGNTRTSIIQNEYFVLQNMRFREKNDRIFYGITTQLSKCKSQLAKVNSFASVPFKNAYDLMFQGLASLLQESMANYTSNYMDHYHSKSCVNGEITKIDNYVDAYTGIRILAKGEPSKYSKYQLLALPEQVTNLRFVSCGGDRGTWLIPFSELFTIYDNYVWALILLSVIALASAIARVPKQTFRLKRHKATFFRLHGLLNTLKVLLEQGDPFPSSISNTINLRYAVGSFLLVGIVISNAYKSENVYNMITLRKPIPYEKFHELVDNNFTIYTRSSFLHFDAKALIYSTKGKLPNLTEVTPHFLTHNQDHIHMLTVTSEVFEWEKTYNSTELNINTWAQISNNTRLHPLIAPVVTSTFYPHIKYYDSVDKDEIRHEVWSAENIHLQNFLSECNRAAVIAPEIIVNRFGKDLQRNNKPNVYVGKEHYSNITIALEFKGWIQSIVLKRIKHVKESGLWEWWPKFVRNSKEFIVEKSYKSLEEKKPNMSGNILQIFLMLVFGLVLAATLFAFETGSKILSTLLQLWCIVLKYVKYNFGMSTLKYFRKLICKYKY